MSRPLPAPGPLAAWVMASRPPTLAAAVVPVAVGVACAAALGGFRPLPSLAALLVAVWIQIGTNFANDVFDFESGADTADRLGPTRAVQAGLLTPAQMRRGMAVAFGLAAVFGLYLASIAGWPLILIGAASILSGIAYTGGPYPLGYHGLGDVFVLIFFGFVAVCATAYVNLGTVPAVAWWAALPVGCLSTNILVVNNVRDRAGDRAAGKGTLVARFGRRAGEAEYALLLAVSYLVPLWLFRGAGRPWILLPLATLPLAGVLLRQLLEREGRSLNATLVGTARLLVLFGALFAAGIFLGGEAEGLPGGTRSAFSPTPRPLTPPGPPLPPSHHTLPGEGGGPAWVGEPASDSPHLRRGIGFPTPAIPEPEPTAAEPLPLAVAFTNSTRVASPRTALPPLPGGCDGRVGEGGQGG